ncbi:MAG TPA: nucleotidyltransferase domain-containing protein [Pyrinomonadaceae bacterium]|jgi:predicted nucleotidyltransferase
MSDERINPVEAARRIWEERYAGARVLFLAGSVLRNEATPTSDLDIVVVYEHLPNAHRESFIFEGWPVEAFVNDPETMNYYFHESDGRQGRPVLAQMILEGQEIPAPSKFSAELKRVAAEFIEAGPPRWSEQDFRTMRYQLTDAVDDIRYPRSTEELVASASELYRLVADFYLRSQNLWSANRKTIPGRLRQVNADFAERFTGAFESLFVRKQPKPLITLVEEMLKPFGGFLFDGFRDDAPATKRKPLEIRG